ncbi:DMT family transporter [Frigidibacter sp. MR17.14]|uniref:DMT family transporter n=1 Tax=Frigidibacter sp. MR17.14 TaxID=3126509 RepID=UPI003012B1B3
MREQNLRRGILLMVTTTFVFSVQDVISRHLAGTYNVWMVTMVRYWFFAAFVVALAARKPGGIRAAARSEVPLLQIFRSVLLVAEVWVMVLAFVALGLVEAHAVFACYPLLVAALSGPVLGEKVGWRRWGAIGIGFVGVMVILQPGFGVFNPAAIVPLCSALMFALYSLLTRYVGRRDSAATSFFWTGIWGAVVATLGGAWAWQPMSWGDWGWMGLLCLFACLAHYLLIAAYEAAEASAIQPFAYLQLVFASIFGMAIFGDTLRPNVALGAGIVVCAGLFTLWRERRRKLTG